MAGDWSVGTPRPRTTATRPWPRLCRIRCTEAGLKPYRAPGWLPGGQAQTLWPLLIKPHPIPLRRERWETPDADFVDVDLFHYIKKYEIYIINKNILSCICLVAACKALQLRFFIIIINKDHRISSFIII